MTVPELPEEAIEAGARALYVSDWPNRFGWEHVLELEPGLARLYRLGSRAVLEAVLEQVGKAYPAAEGSQVARPDHFPWSLSVVRFLSVPPWVPVYRLRTSDE